jgi:hypothetical protein
MPDSGHCARIGVDYRGGSELRTQPHRPAAASGFETAGRPRRRHLPGRRFSTPEHGGTHLDAPIHFAAGGHAVDRVELHRLIAPAVVIDISNRAANDPDYRLSADAVRTWEAQHGDVPRGAIVLLRTAGAGTGRTDARTSTMTRPATRRGCASRASARTRRGCWWRSATSRCSARTSHPSTTAAPQTSSCTASRRSGTCPASRT